MYNLLEYSSNYSGTTGILWFYSKNEATNLVLILHIIMIIILNLLTTRLNYYQTQLLNPHQIIMMEV